jgi:alginate O-acetyltransferase complex protein AlgI
LPEVANRGGMISWSFACATLLLALVPPTLPAPLRTPVLLVVSLAGVTLVWELPVFGIAGVAVAVWGLGAMLPRIPHRARGMVVAIAVGAVVASLAWLRLRSPSRDSLVPATAIVGLSYFSLKFIQHLVDAGAGRVRHVGPASFLVAVVFPSTYAAGPIERTNEFADKLAAPPLAWAERLSGLERIVFGLAKKLLVGNPLLAYAEPVFAVPALAGRGTLWLATYAFAVALYLDFAAYSDIAIGSARLAGIRVRENFDHPYVQPNLALLWQRWHMSLTSWLRDFVFVPVARRALRITGRPLVSQAIAQMTTMLLCGLWHGVAWNFVAWGLYHGALLAALGALRARRTARAASVTAVPAGASSAATGVTSTSRLRYVAAVLVTFHAFAIGLVLFGCPLRTALHFIARMFWLDTLVGI